MNKRLLVIATCLMAILNTTIAEDKMTVSDIKMAAGETKEVSISLVHDMEYVAFQFDFYLPAGMTVEEYSANSSRIPESTTLSMKPIEGGYRFLASAMQGKPLVGHSGAIVNLKITAAEDLAPGTLTGYFRKVKLAKADATGSTYAEFSFPITIIEPSTVIQKGDANGDGVVNVTDIVEIVNAILGHHSDKFNETAADVNGDGQVNVTDIVSVVNIILSDPVAARFVCDGFLPTNWSFVTD